jgi:hypothetical protein
MGAAFAATVLAAGATAGALGYAVEGHWTSTPEQVDAANGDAHKAGEAILALVPDHSCDQNVLHAKIEDGRATFPKDPKALAVTLFRVCKANNDNFKNPSAEDLAEYQEVTEKVVVSFEDLKEKQLTMEWYANRPQSSTGRKIGFTSVFSLITIGAISGIAGIKRIADTEVPNYSYYQRYYDE